MNKRKKIKILVAIVLSILAFAAYYNSNKVTKNTVVETATVNTPDTLGTFPAGEKDYIKDFNFDGVNDLSIHTSNSGGYGGPVYSVYLKDPQTGKYVHNEEISHLISIQGLFDLDKTRKVIINYTKDGCCSHMTEEYQVNADNSLKKVYTKTEDVDFEKQSEQYTYYNITESKLINDKWVTTTSTKKEINP